jgi:hypothetical protein
MTAACLLSAFIVLVESCSLDERLDVFFEVSSSLQKDNVDMQLSKFLDDAESLLKCLHHAKENGWIEYEELNNELISDQLDEFLHYSSPANGSLYQIIPRKLIIFTDPTDLPDGCLWMDTSEDGRTVRQFSNQYYAELFHDMAVPLVVRLNEGHPSTGDTFAALGIYCESGLLPQRNPCAMLRVYDRLLMLVRASSGPVALQVGAESADLARTLAMAYLIGREGLGNLKEAGAWLQLVCPWLARLAAADERV